MHDSPLAAIHGIEAVGCIALPDTPGNGKRAKPEFFLAKQPEVIGIKAQVGVLVRTHFQHFLRQLLQSKQGLAFVGHQARDVRTLELHDQSRPLEIGLYLIAVIEVEVDIEICCVQDAVEEVFNLIPDGGDVVFSFAHEFWTPGYFFFLAGGAAGTTGETKALLKKYCWKMPTTLPVSQYNTSPLDAL